MQGDRTGFLAVNMLGCETATVGETLLTYTLWVVPRGTPRMTIFGETQKGKGF